MVGVDFHEVRHRVKLVEETGNSRVFENRDGVRCPVCEEPFDEALESERHTEQLNPAAGLSLCIVNEDDVVILFTHASDS
jgi:DNA repair exonuclease SbcCD ATPase subunit